MKESFPSTTQAPSLTPPDRHPWMASALCTQVDPELFFDASSSRYESMPTPSREAKAIGICQRCHVRSECLAYALQNDERYGIWGGMTERERRGIKRMRPA